MTSQATMNHMVKIANFEPFVKISVNLKFTADTHWLDYTCLNYLLCLSLDFSGNI